ncbi:unnamed protein product [Agarophyton chilense]|eukprot:gb/GEZJ01000551.1/.p1 GENE.gb/GEZJ01000551.1/~~gb/GEZJ01000551.1/.p1  ORF type:complete len:780 (-),score=106.52 gb/GEZJ01000551.1/:4294-6633(-)
MDSKAFGESRQLTIDDNKPSTFVSQHGSVALHVGKLPSSFLFIVPMILPSAMIAVLPEQALFKLNVRHGRYMTMNKRISKVYAAEALLPESENDGSDVAVLSIALLSPCLHEALTRDGKALKTVDIESIEPTLLESVVLSSILPNPLPSLQATRVATLAKRSITGRDVSCGDIFPVSSNVWLMVNKVQGYGLVGKSTSVAVALGPKHSRVIHENQEHMRAWACAKWRDAVPWDFQSFTDHLCAALDEHARIILLEGLNRDVEDVLNTALVGRTSKWVRYGSGRDLTEAIARCELAGGGAVIVEQLDNEMKDIIRVKHARYEGHWAHWQPFEDEVCVVLCTEHRDDVDREIMQIVDIDIPIPKASEEDRREVLRKTIATRFRDEIPHDIEELVRLSTGFARREVYELGNVWLSKGMKACREAVSYFDKGKLSVNSGGVTWADVGGLDEAKEQILDLVEAYDSAAMLRSLEQKTSRIKTSNRRVGLLLYGPPGTGKTLLARAVANECGCSFIAVKGPELLDMYVGESEKNVREVFERAMIAAPCVVFFDELDALAPNRGRGADSGGVSDRVVSQLLSELDLISTRPNIFVIAATNRPDLIDSGLLRPGRLDKMVYIPMPQSREEQAKILKAQTEKFLFADDVDLGKALSHAPEPPGLSGADLYGMASNAWMSAAKRTVTESELGDARNNSLIDNEDKFLWNGSRNETEEYEMFRDWFSGERMEVEDPNIEEPVATERRRQDKNVIVVQNDLVAAAESLIPSLSMSQLQEYEELRRTLESGL